MKHKFSLLLSLITLVCSSCGNSPARLSQLKLISPNGAPCLALYNFAKNGNLEINTNPALVGGQLQADNYDMVVFDFSKGLESLSRNHGHYKLAKILTGGNLYLVGINKDESKKEPKSGDLVVSFGEGLIPDLTFKQIYNDRGIDVRYVQGVSDIAPILKSGKFQTEEVDYVVIAEPLLSKLMKDLDQSHYTIISLRDKWGEVKQTSPIIPQAGLFVNMNSYQKNETVFNDYLKQINADIDVAINEPIKVKQIMEEKGDASDQEKIFGFTAEQVYEVQKDGRNGFALVGNSQTIDINDFFLKIGQSVDYSEYILSC